MFDYLKGIIGAKTQNEKGSYFTIEICGIGYLAEVTSIDYEQKNVDDAVKLYVVLNHKEDSMTLCGFLSKEARDIFKVLTSVSGVGVKMALTLLNEFEVCDLIYHVINENAKEITKAKGVGAKLAQKIILELKDKFINLKQDINIPKNQDVPQEARDVQNILLSLGYEDDEIANAIKQVLEKGYNLSENEIFLRETLKILSI
ncbi:MAG: Holliday junction branch migration protein RuvA [Candidatus Gastranaerophilaceae bacterium]